ncbi:hypothetical protein [Paratractidigestivibacter sp.]|uniref:hypothetical protein n=1 Tax=Paratractidigestivibacter sp. TaxID=2847316 RepID=UPI002AC963F2|nr:hypothetical protein [Paratractidigestivibacter sp.]
MDYVYSIKVDAGKLSAGALMTIKRLTGLSLGGIKEAAMNDRAVFGCDCVDDEGLLLIRRLHDELAEIGVPTKIYWYESEEPYQNLLNLIQMHREIDEEDFPD